MVVLKILLKLFPKSFQESMGDAWLEASETEIKQRQIKQGRKKIVVLAFAWETLWNVLPEAHNNTRPSQGYTSVENFVPQENEIVLKSFLFGINVLRFYCFGIIIGLHVAVAKFVPEMINVWKFTVPATIVLLFIFNKFINQKSQKTEKKFIKMSSIVSAVSGLIPGYITPFLFLVSIVSPYEMDNTGASFNQYQEIKNQMGLSDNDQGRTWFVGEGDSRVLRPDKKQQWCDLNRARIETATTMLQGSGAGRLSGMLVAALSFQTYKNGCWENDGQYIALRHTIAAKSLGKNLFLDLLKDVDWVIGSSNDPSQYDTKRYAYKRLRWQIYCY